jgi:hypothetical protein
VVTTLPLKNINLDVELQPREDIDHDLIDEYAEALEAGDEFPPVVVFKNGDAKPLLADGWHRYYAHQSAKRPEIAVEIREGDRVDAFRYSLQANATHGRKRSNETIRRSYDRAIKAGVLVDSADSDEVMALLKVSRQRANELTREAREVRKAAMKSLAMALAATCETSERKIAKRLRVDPATIRGWVGNSADTGGIPHYEHLPSEAELVAIAEEIDEAARKQVLPQVRKEMEAELDRRIVEIKDKMEASLQRERDKTEKERARAEAQQKRAAEAIEKLKDKLARTNDRIDEARDEAARKAAEQTAKELSKEIAAAEAKLAKDRMALDKDKARIDEAREAIEAEKAALAEQPLAETDEEASERERKGRLEAAKAMSEQLSGPAADAWFAVLKAIETAQDIKVSDLESLSYQLFEKRVLQGAAVAIARLRAASAIAERSVDS